ncbi:MAG: hypothetical protein HY898_09185 [Deltaproteobacteria bacterium]|nr:hypothetical protein [Deltaproteobacteria bacterium]
MSSRLSPLKAYSPRSYPKARGTAVGRILVAASMAATSLGGCGPAMDPHTVDSAVDKGDLDATVDKAEPDQGAPDTPPDQAPDGK